ncbi:unnamed protein product [Prorocentrum cordatum]|uniref:EF-hand domain-containing protein n=1 Tax=Prorocentrum cordatum TaxID=2364126 RepID=A0ABN9RKD0_9DINO|nr:unnamed protein product [Polarella glacialis]
MERLAYHLGIYAEMGATRLQLLEYVLHAAEVFFSALFTFEVTLRYIAMQQLFWKDWSCVMDFFIVLATDASLVLEQIGDPSFNVQVVRLLRCTRVLRIFRLSRHNALFESASLMSAALQSCVGAATCAIMIFFTGLSLLALLITRLVRDMYLSDASHLDERQKVQLWMYFGSYSRSMLSMFELALANWPTIGRFLQDEVHEWWMIFIIIFKLTVGFAVETFTAIEMDNNIMVEKKRRADKAHRKKMEALFKKADRNGDGAVGRHEFAHILRLPAVIRTWLASMNLDVSDGALGTPTPDTAADPVRIRAP